jgi:hypothetical protein
MKILYSTGNRIGGDIQLKRFLRYNEHEVKIAAYMRSSGSLTHVDWTLDALGHKYCKGSKTALSELFGHAGIPHIGLTQAVTLMEEIYAYEPDLIICDGEPIVANIAKTLNIKLWYCSPLHLLDGIRWERGQLRYFSLLDKTRKALTRLPKADKTFIYSPFGDVSFRPMLKEGYEWVRPYYHDVGGSRCSEGIAVIRDPKRISILSKILNCVPPFNFTLFSPFSYNLSHLESKNISTVEKYKIALSNCKWLFTTGETSFISDAIYNGVDRICIAPNLDDPESLLNAILCRYYNIGDDVGQVEYMEQHAVGEVEKSYNKMYKSNSLSVQDRSYLHEKVNNEESSI